MSPVRIASCAVAGALFTLGSAEAATIRIDFGHATEAPANTTVAGWNNLLITTTNATPSLSNLVDSTNAATTVDIATTDAFVGVNHDGIQGANNTSGFPDTATDDSWFINSGTGNGFPNNPLGQLTITQLPAGQYNFGFFASRMNSDINTTVNRQTNYTINGNTVTLDADDNMANMVWLNNVAPDINGTVVLDVTKNPSGGAFGYLGVLVIDSVPEPTSLGFLAIGAAAMLRRRKA